MFCKCGERFVGMFCHGCGSKAVDKKPPQISTSRSDAAQDALNRLMERREKDINQKKGEKTVKVKVEDEVKKTDTSKRTIHVHLVTKKGEDIKPKIIQFSQAHKFIILQADESETSEEWVAMINSLIPGIDFSIVTHDSNGVLSQKVPGKLSYDMLRNVKKDFRRLYIRTTAKDRCRTTNSYFYIKHNFKGVRLSNVSSKVSKSWNFYIYIWR
ncbi:unnamed protein product [Owenia fusiformis]|uniref:Uncharacterized protein n=1 Tax=Owenia fusiformis TaxID=6347 RepID=A0A8S4PHS2_OWEFU|nr:unnamed protein product [Owenia fusiformis]